ncbi:MAG TPA: response regulator [Thermoanaerobaculia bacterium]|nr:response regulator [Thermoanaerobaculia bacterium]
MRILLIDDNPEDRELARRVLEHGRPGLEIQEILDAAGLERALEQGGFDAVVTDYRLLERERAAREAAEAASLMKDEFLATLSHELRTPLNAILGWAALLRSGNLQGDRLRQALESITRNARSQARLIDDLLDVSAIMSGKMSLNSQPVDLANVAEAAMDAVRPAADAKRIHLESDLSAWPRGMGLVWGDPDRLQQVVWNLLSNGVKFTPEGGTVKVCLDIDRDQARLIVIDNGPGIDGTFLPHVFEPFRQEDGTITRSHGGLGLGLAIVRRLVELHGGTVRAESDGPGFGAAFEVRFPLRVPEPERRLREPQFREEPRPSFHCPPNVPGLRILVVDDEADARDLVSTLLERCGARVRVASSAREALEEMKRFRPDVILCDLAMPGEDGYALIRRIRALPASEGGRVPAAALTAHARAEDRRKTLLAGFNMHVPKPVDPEELLAVVASLGGWIGGAEEAG